MSKANLIAKINEEQCIGCTKCIEVCPVDAIMGASKQLHVVIDEQCIGCELCLPPCPVNCITLEDAGQLDHQMRLNRAALAKQKHQARKIRLERQQQCKEEKDKQVTGDIKAMIAASIARSKQKHEQS